MVHCSTIKGSGGLYIRTRFSNLGGGKDDVRLGIGE